jgi:two-component system response regulator WspF
MRIGIIDEPRRAELLQLAIQLGGEHQVAWLAGSEAALTERLVDGPPDLVLLNLEMPSMDALVATRRLAGAGSAVLITARGQADPGRVFEAIGHGALDAISLGDAMFPEAMSAVLLPKIASVARWIGKSAAKVGPADERGVDPQRLIAIGASAGGPAALSVVLAGLPRTLPAGVIVVQHLGEDFTLGVAEWLRRCTELDVRVARDGDRPAPGTVLVAGGNDHLIFKGGGRLGYTPEPHDKIYRPSIDVFFDSVCRLWRGTAIGVLLTGMGRDGAQGLQAMRARGHHTIAQDEATSAVYGMPKAAAAINAAVDILPLDAIAARIVEVVATPVRTRRR